MYNNLFQIGPFQVHSYGLCIAVGIIAAYLLAERHVRKKGLEPDRFFWAVVCAILLGFVCCKLLYLLTHIEELIAHPEFIMDALVNGWVVYGGILGGVLGAVLYFKVKKCSAFAYLDCAFIYVPLAQACGRIGCFMAGCCYGQETDSPLGVVFTHSEFAPNGVRLIPTQLISAGLDALLCLLLFLVDRKKKKNGTIIGLYMICYGIGRFILEFFRGDLDRGAVGVLSTSQFISIPVVAAGILILLFINRKKETKETEEPQETEETEETA